MPDGGKDQGGDPFGGGGISGGYGGGDGGGPGGGNADDGPPITTLVEDAEQGRTHDAANRRVPLSELLRERRRAQDAEARATQLEQRVTELEGALTEARETLDSVERRHRIDLALMESDAVDLETARLLTEMTVSQMPDADVDAAVNELRRRKPFLFGARPPAISSAAMGGYASSGLSAAEVAANEAAASGDRRALLRYLRARRRDG